MKISILDDYLDTLRTLPCFSKLAGHDVTIWNDHVQDVDTLAERLNDTEALVLIRERTQIRAPLLERLPKLKLISQRSVYPHIDIDACTRLGVIVSSSQHPGTPSYATAELTWGLILAAMRQIPQQMAALKAGQLADRRRHDAARQDARHLRLRPHRQRGRRLRPGVRHEGAGLGARRRSRPARADGYATAPSKAGVLRGVRRHLAAHAAGRRDARHRHRGRPGAHEADGAAGQYQPRAADRARRAGRCACAPDGPAWPRSTSTRRSRCSIPRIRCSTMENVVCTPHIGYVTRDEYEMQFTDIFDQIIAYAAGTPINVVNPDVLKGKRR